MSDTTREDDIDVLNQVEALNEKTKALALNLAIYLAKAKAHSSEIGRMEPEFVRLVNGTVRVVQQVTAILQTAKNLRAAEQSQAVKKTTGDLVEARLRSIVDQCARIMASLSSEVSPS